MESIVLEDSPLADYFEGEGVDNDNSTDSPTQENEAPRTPSPSFAPRGIPKAALKFRSKLPPPPLRLAIPQSNFEIIQRTCSKAVNARIGRADNARFLERFRYIIVASQLLNNHTHFGQTQSRSKNAPFPSPEIPQPDTITTSGAALTVSSALGLVVSVNWALGDRKTSIGIGRAFLLFDALVIVVVVSLAYFRRKWLQYLRQQNLTAISAFVTQGQEFDSAASGALTLIQEVELVARGYRISTPLPPVSRLDDSNQTRRCARLRKQLRLCFAEIIPRYNQAFATIKPFTEEMDLEKYYDIYDISETDFAEAMLGYNDIEFEDHESVRILKILAARFYTSRKILLCCLMALDAHGGKEDFDRWRIACDELHAITEVTEKAEERLHHILSEEESFPVPPTPKLPLTPNRERWRAQLRQLNSLSTGIRGLQAKLHFLRDESDKNLNEAEDVSELGTTLMLQYESIGIDLKGLMQEWEDGKNALASNIDRNEKRISSMSGMLSPALSLGGLTAVDEAGGSSMDALKALNGEIPCRSIDLSSSDAEEIFEAVAYPPRQRSTLTREERIIKMKEDRVKRESMRDKTEASTRMLRELESVINMRPRSKAQQTRRITSI